jgi:hypothetical protein
MAETIFQKLTRAIKEKKQITFEYHHPDKPDKWGKRVGNPHAIYIHQDSHDRVDIIQISGVGTNDPNLPKPYLLEYIQNVGITNNSFTVCSNFNSNAPRYLKKLIDINENAN